jgi:tRNA A-37 threonylcarbamoyl transferase component Bud32
VSQPPDSTRVLGGRYELRNVLARGGMATVWIADDTVLARRVAVKLLHPELAVDPDVRERFRREGLAAARLNHPHIVAVYDAGEDGAAAYIVMELVDGDSLRRVLDARGELGVNESVRIGREVAEALGYAHREGLIHRDVKPANVLVNPDGRAKVADFGIAKALSGGSDLTRTGTVVGTARYLAPEQVDGRAVDARTDVYALGLVLYEMLTGEVPHATDSDIATAVARATGVAPSVRLRRPDVAVELDEVIGRALAPDPATRFSDGDALAAALGGEVPVGPPRGAAPVDAVVVRRRRMPWTWLVLSVGLVVATVAGAAWVTRTRHPSRSATVPISIAAVTDFDPAGDGHERPDLVEGAWDGDPATAWTTEHYATPAFGNAKAGVGLVIDLGKSRPVGRVDVDADQSGWSADVYVADDVAPDLAGWGSPATTGEQLGTTASFATDANGRYVLLWLTGLPASGKLGISEVHVGG